MRLKVDDTVIYINEYIDEKSQEIKYKIDTSKIIAIYVNRNQKVVQTEKSEFPQIFNYTELERTSNLMAKTNNILLRQAFICNSKSRLRYYKETVEYWNKNGVDKRAYREINLRQDNFFKNKKEIEENDKL